VTSVAACSPLGESGLFVRVDRARGVLTVVGELDAGTAPRLLEAAATVDPHGNLTIDLHGLLFIGAAGLNALVRIRIAQENQRLSLVGVSPQTARVLRAGGLAGLIA
jgi:anti-anti-sigma factor